MEQLNLFDEKRKKLPKLEHKYKSLRDKFPGLVKEVQEKYTNVEFEKALKEALQWHEIHKYQFHQEEYNRRHYDYPPPLQNSYTSEVIKCHCGVSVKVIFRPDKHRVYMDFRGSEPIINESISTYYCPRCGSKWYVRTPEILKVEEVRGVGLHDST